MRNIIVSVVALCLLMTGCNSRTPQYRIGVSQCLDDAWRQKMNYEMERELLLHPDMTLSRRIAYGSNELQCAQIDSFIRERVDLLIVSPNEAEQVQPAVTRAYRAGIPVIVADRRVPGDEWTAFIGGDNYKVGRLMAQWVIGKASDKGSKAKGKPFVVLEVAGLPGSTPATLRHKGMMEGIEEAKGEGLEAKVEVQSVMGRWYQENAHEVVSEYLETHPLPDVIVAHNDLMAIGAAEAVAHYQTSHHKSQRYVPIMGVDGIHPGLQAIVEGKIECSATYSSRGDMVIDAAARIIQKEPYVRDTVLETTLVDRIAAYPMLKQDEAITRDLETLHIVQMQLESKWKQQRFDRFILILFVVLFFTLFIITLGYIFVKQRKIQTEIKHDILPQLEEVQEAIQLSKKDEAFAERLRQVVDDYLKDPNLNVEFLGGKLQLSRTQLFRRVKAVAGKGPLDYIREQRLIRADELLRTTDMTVQQVAMEFCFSNPGYFTKCYKEYFGHLPSAR
ncbi:MAG: substrate-binding domain-containing protein [Paludibacteraceae bacterium]|nr:substrate-binding domain-containing protein [Paludibacteraceae bacterium]